jgi:hypothetical protein
VKRTSAKHELAATLLAEDRLSDAEIARRCGVTERTLNNWKQQPEFQKRLSAVTAKFSDRVVGAAITQKNKRLEVLQNLQDRLLQVVDERSQDPAMAKVPGGKTGLVVRKLKTVGTGNDARVVPEYSIDGQVLKEIQQVHKNARAEARMFDPEGPHE